MKLLYDQNLSPKLTQRLQDIFPESVHVRDLNMQKAKDLEIWNYAKEHGYSIVTKDTDFYQRSIFFGHPPKIILLRIGNASVKEIEEYIRSNSISINTFFQKEIESILIL